MVEDRPFSMVAGFENPSEQTAPPQTKQDSEQRFGMQDLSDSTEKLRAEIQDLKAQIKDALAKLESRGSTAGFFSSGLFFIILGLLLLATAAFSLGIVHTTFSFVLIVLGTAILLYGTGTQGMGRFDAQGASAKYNVALAGGGWRAFVLHRLRDCKVLQGYATRL